MNIKRGHPLRLFRFCPKCGSARFIENNGHSKRCESCGFTYYFNPRAAVVAVILNDEGEILVCRRAKDPAKGTLDLPGGFTESYETAEEAVNREIKEETGLDIVQTRYLFSLPNVYTYSGFDVHTMDLFFESRVVSSENLEARDDVAECFFIPFGDINPEDFGLASIRAGIKKIITSKDLLQCF